MKRIIHWIAGVAAMFALIVPAVAVSADAWPTKTIRIVVGYPPGVPPDAAARVLAEKMGKSMGQTVIVDNRSGAAGTIAADQVAHATPDGYTLLMGLAANLGSGPHLMPSAKYDPTKSFAPIGFIQRGPYFIIVPADSPFQTFDQLREYTLKNPGKLDVGVPGIGSVHHLTWELLMKQTGMKATIVPVSGTSAMITETLGGRLQTYIDSAGSLTAEQVKAGKLRLLAMTGDHRMAEYPAVPSLKELGVNGVVTYSWWCLVAPAGTPEPIIARLNSEMQKALNLPEVRELLRNEGVPLEGMRADTPAAVGAWISSEYSRWGRLIGELGIKPTGR